MEPPGPVMTAIDALDTLEDHAAESDFSVRWRGFVRDCAALLLPTLPDEARAWQRAADDYDAERLTIEQLTEVRVRAIQFADARRDVVSHRESSGLRVAMYRLWPAESPDRWFESASYFLDFCNAAGIEDDELCARLRVHFSEILEPGPAPGSRAG